MYICTSYGFPYISVSKESAIQEASVWLLGWEDTLEKGRLPTSVFLGFPCGQASKESACHMEGLGSIPGLGRSSGKGKGYSLQYSGLENPMDCIIHWVGKSQTWLSHFHIHICHIYILFSILFHYKLLQILIIVPYAIQ